jgi:hypothetical protein
MEIVHLCYMLPLKNEVLPCYRFQYVFDDFETTQNVPYMNCAKAKVHFPNLVCLQQSCSNRERLDDISEDCARCGMGQHTSWVFPERDMLTYLCEPRPLCEQILTIAENV